MFTIEQILLAHDKVKSGSDFPNYIWEIKSLGVVAFETWVKDSHTLYYGTNDYSISSQPMYPELIISEQTDRDKFVTSLKTHQEGKTDYQTFCKDCAETGIEKWTVSLEEMTCIYYDSQSNAILVEKIPSQSGE